MQLSIKRTAAVTTDILDCSRPIPSPQKPTCQNSSLSLSVKPGQAYPQDSINEFVIPKLNPLVLVDFRFISALHA